MFNIWRMACALSGLITGTPTGVWPFLIKVAGIDLPSLAKTV